VMGGSLKYEILNKMHFVSCNYSTRAEEGLSADGGFYEGRGRGDTRVGRSKQPRGPGQV
jgi:hypothetical protein